jgi:hypothetical protein
MTARTDPPRLRGRTEVNMRRDDATHRETLAAILEPVTSHTAGRALGVSAETCAARLRKYLQAGLAERASAGRWQITQSGRDALASEALIVLSERREEPMDVWAILLGARRPLKVSGRPQGKMQMGRA